MCFFLPRVFDVVTRCHLIFGGQPANSHLGMKLQKGGAKLTSFWLMLRGGWKEKENFFSGGMSKRSPSILRWSEANLPLCMHFNNLFDNKGGKEERTSSFLKKCHTGE